MRKIPSIPAILAIVVGIFAATAWVDEIGGFRWFWPYDKEVSLAAGFAIILEIFFVIPRLEPWFREVRTKIDHEDSAGP